MSINIDPDPVVPVVTMVNSGGSLVAGAVLYAAPCILRFVHVAHTTGAATYIQIHDSASVPAEGAVPLLTHSVASGEDARIEDFPPIYFENGLYVCESSTVPTKTIALVAHLFATAGITV